jgi:transcriptional/translational regulatory protein YebC/TACO1
LSASIIELADQYTKVVAPPELLSLMTKTLSQPPHSYKLSESELQWRPIDPELAKAEAEALSEESKENLSTLMNDLEEYSECVGVWSSID